MTTTVVYADTSDGKVTSSNASWATMQAGSGLSADTTSAYVNAGQFSFGTPTGTTYYCSFDTSSIGTDSISAAVFAAYLSSYTGSSTVVAELRSYDWGTSVTTVDWLTPSAFGSATLVADIVFSGISAGSLNDFVDDALPANVNKTGSTRLALSTDRFRLATSDNGALQNVGTADQDGTTSDPKLTITHAAGGASLFLILEDGSGAYEKEDSSGGILLEA